MRPGLSINKATMRSNGVDPTSEKGLKILEHFGDRTKEFSELLPAYKTFETSGGFKIGFDVGE
jgi:hypothetical protein